MTVRWGASSMFEEIASLTLQTTFDRVPILVYAEAVPTSASGYRDAHAAQRAAEQSQGRWDLAEDCPSH